MLSAILAVRDISSPAELERADFFCVYYDKIHTKKNRRAPIRPEIRYLGLLNFVSYAPTVMFTILQCRVLCPA